MIAAKFTDLTPSQQPASFAEEQQRHDRVQGAAGHNQADPDPLAHGSQTGQKPGSG